jgi:signal peptidase
MSTTSMSSSSAIPAQAGSAGEFHPSAERRDGGEGRARSGPSATVFAALALFLVTGIITVAGFGISFVRLATGSMSPTFPADSVLLVRSVAADSVEMGDVVTVSRDGTVPITHRVVSVTPMTTGAELVLRGDANTADDPEPYQVSRVGLVLSGIPLGGSALVALQSPLGLGAATVVVALLVLWAWWPRREPGAHVATAGSGNSG